MYKSRGGIFGYFVIEFFRDGVFLMGDLDYIVLFFGVLLDLLDSVVGADRYDDFLFWFIVC